MINDNGNCIILIIKSKHAPRNAPGQVGYMGEGGGTGVTVHAAAASPALTDASTESTAKGKLFELCS